MKNTLQKIEAAVLNFLKRVEHKLPEILTEVANSALTYTLAAEAILTGKQAGQIEALVPATVPFATEIVAVLKELEVAFKALATAGGPGAGGSGTPITDKGTFEKGLLFAAAGKIAAIQHENQLPMNRYNLAVQAEYSTHPASVANVA